MRVLLIGFICCLLGAVQVRAEGALRLMTEEFAPFNFQEDGSLKGVGSDVVRAIAKRQGITVEPEVLPWKRAYSIARKQPDAALFSIARLPHREDHFKWVGPLFFVQDYLFGREDMRLQVNSLEDARYVRSILVQDGGGSHGKLLEMGFTNLKPYYNTGSSLQLLLNGRGTLIYLSDLTAVHQMRRQNLPLNRIKAVFNIGRTALYLGFSPATADEVVHRWRSALEALVESGRHAEILNDYRPRVPGW